MNKFTLGLYQVSNLDNKMLLKMQELQNECKNLVKINIFETLPLDIISSKQQLQVNKLQVDFDTNTFEISIENLSQLQILEEFEASIGFNIKIQASEQKISCPPKMTIKMEKIISSRIETIFEILDAFQNYENVSILHLKSWMCKIPQGKPFMQLYSKLQHFQSIRDLIIPFSCEEDTIQSLMNLLQALKKLVHLSLENFIDEPEIDSVVNKLSQYAFGNMLNLRTLSFFVNSPIQMSNFFNCYQRPSPLTITIIQANGFALRTRFIYDRGQEGIMISKFDNNF
ncbi:hypothetical protein FGO68_gene3870 [Halteria grandinella]|uniref:Uncharacterized protein n=1 Tax=Halteria grandinella TaxID=5974 RepID=A0A8J8SX82_HALGN|nr:hypothetical protein FGO68_gene3870 [Halteria grandinella]